MRYGPGQTRFNIGHGMGFLFPLRPMDEYAALVEGLDGAGRAPLDTGIPHLDRKVELLREYPSRVVADVVIGEVGVAEAAPLLREPPRECASEDHELAEETNPGDAETVA